MNIALVQTAWFVQCSQQEMIQWLWAMSWWVCHWVIESNEDRCSMVTTTILLRGVHTFLLFWWHTLWQLGKALNKQSWQHKQKYHTNISRHKETNDQQNHAKSCKREGYIVGHLSLTQILALDIPSGVATVRDHKGAPKKERFECL